MKTIFFAFILCLLLNGCKKEDATDSSNNTEGEDTTLTLSAAQATPGDMLEIILDKKVTENEVDIVFNMNTIKGYANGDSTYMFIVPIVTSGNVIITIPSFKGANTLSLTISKYDPIINPQIVINEFVEARNQCIDSITKVIPGRNYQISPESAILLNQLKEEWALLMGKLTESDKEMLAYFLQKNMPGLTSSFTSSSVNTTKSIALKEDAGEKLVALAKSFVTAELICLAHIPILAASAVAIVPPTTLISSLFFIAVFNSFIIAREVAILRGEQVGEMQGLADAIVDIVLKSAKVIEFTNNSEMALSMTVEFRNLNPGDASIQTDINSAYNTEKTFVKKDDEIRNLYQKATSLFSKLVGTYPSYSPVIGSSAKKTSIQAIDGADIQIKGVSDNRISYTTSLSGNTRKIKITSTATTEFNFNLTIAYKRKLDGKEFTKEIACTFKPQSYKLGFSDYTKGHITNAEIAFENSELESFILLNDNGTTATGIDYSQISITNKTNSYVTIGIVPVLGTNGSFILQFKNNSPTSEYFSFDVLYQSKKIQTINAKIILFDFTGSWTLSYYTMGVDGVEYLHQQLRFTCNSSGYASTSETRYPINPAPRDNWTPSGSVSLSYYNGQIVLNSRLGWYLDVKNFNDAIFYSPNWKTVYTVNDYYWKIKMERN